MKTYLITIPAYTSVITAENKKAALEQFWFDFDAAQQDPESNKPIIEETRFFEVP